MKTLKGPTWIRGVDVSRVLGARDQHLASRLAAKGLVRTLKVQGMRPRYCQEDVETLLFRAVCGFAPEPTTTTTVQEVKTNE